MKARIISLIVAVLLVVSLVPLTLAPAGAVAGSVKIVKGSLLDASVDTAAEFTALTTADGGSIKTGDIVTVVLSDGDLNASKAMTAQVLSPVDAAGNALAATTVTSEATGTGDGTDTTFTLGAFLTAVNRALVPGSLTVTVGGVGTTAFTVNARTGVITFTTAPAGAAAIVSTYQWVLATKFYKAAVTVDTSAGPFTIKVDADGAGTAATPVATNAVFSGPASNIFQLLVPDVDAPDPGVAAVTGDFFVFGFEVVNTTTVSVSGAGSISVTLTETGINSGIFRGVFRAGQVTADTLTAVTDEAVGTGNGATTVFALDHSPVATTPALVASVAGVPTTVTVDQELGTITFGAAPAASAAITATYTYSDEVLALHGQVVTITYTDASPVATLTPSLTVDSVEPAAAPTPANLGTVNSVTPTLTVDVTDANSGVAALTATPPGFEVLTDGAYAGLTDATTLAGLADGTMTATGLTVTSTVITGGSRVSVAVAAGAGFAVGNNVWRVKTADKAGNIKVFTFVAVVDTAKPTAGSVETGRALSAAGAITSDNTSSVGVRFNEPLDPASVAATDFTVAGNTVTAATVGPAANDATLGINKNTAVFLTLGTPIGPADKPAVTVVSAVNDAAGNAIDLTSTVSPAVSDKIAATWTATVTDPAGGPASQTPDTTKVVVTIKSNEGMSTQFARLRSPGTQVTSEAAGTGDAATTVFTLTNTPVVAGSLTVTVGGVAATETATPTTATQYSVVLATGAITFGAAPATGAAIVATYKYNQVAALTLVASLTESNTWTSSTSNAAGFTSPLAPGQSLTWTLQVWGADIAGNNAGTATAPKDVVTLKIDNTLAAPELSMNPVPTGGADTAGTAGPWAAGNVDSQGPVVSVKYAEAVTISTATLTPAGGTAADVKAQIASADSKNFSLVTTGLTLDKQYTLAVSAKDALGNTLAKSATFTPIKTTVTVALTPGWNLISIPRTLVSMTVADVLSGVTSLSKIYSYDAASQSWSAAQFVDGAWVEIPGLTPITRFALGKGYLVEATGVANLTLQPSPINPLDVPPTHTVAAGWNLVGYTTLTLNAAQPVSDYLVTLGTNWARLLKFSQGGYTVITRVTGGTSPAGVTMDLGKGVWIFMVQGAELAP